MKKDSGLAHDIVIITIITLVAGLLLGLVHSITAGPIAEQHEKTRIETQQAVFADATSFEAVEGVAENEAIINAVADAGLTKTEVKAIDVAYDASGNELGYVITSMNKEGYGGEIEIMTGVNTTGDEPVVNAIAFLELAETAGMGMKADLPAFKDQFINFAPGGEKVVFTKTGKSAPNEIDAISGSTVTTTAVTKALNAALIAVGIQEGGAS